MEKTEIIAKAQSLLHAAWGEDIRLRIEQTYENLTTTVIRCRLTNAGEHAPTSVAVKHVRPHPENPLGYLYSFLNDWAACLFLNSFDHDPPLAPRFYGADTEHAILVMENLGAGDGPDTIALLERGDPADAAHALLEHSALVGQLHAATIGRADDYFRLREQLGPLAPYHELFTYPVPRTSPLARKLAIR